SVKCSLLFLQKFTEEEQQRFDETYAIAKTEIEARYVDELKAERERLENAIETAKQGKDTEQRKALQKELKDYLRAMEVRQITEARQLLKERFDYLIFMYEAEKVGISATGEEDQ